MYPVNFSILNFYLMYQINNLYFHQYSIQVCVYHHIQLTEYITKLNLMHFSPQTENKNINKYTLFNTRIS